MKSKSIIVWMIKDPNDKLSPMLGIHLTRKEARKEASAAFACTWDLLHAEGWSTIRVSISEVINKTSRLR